MSTLIVYLNDERVGSLEQNEGGLLQFSYERAWLENPNAMPLSYSLPLQNSVFAGKKARPFFAGILPEAEPRRQIARILGISDTNDFAMLSEMGGECAGAVSLLPEGVTPTATGIAHSHELTEPELEQIVAELPRRPLLVGREGLRLSLAGAQDKLPVILHRNGISLPLGHTPSTHILKPEPDRFPGLAANELFCMTLARAVGLNVPNVEYRTVGEKPCILVQRYDRETDEEMQTIRIHQEDFCQAMGFPPERKYQAEGGPTLLDAILLLREWSTTPVLDIPAFIDSLIFNVLIGNADAHAKNYSLLYFDGTRRLSPFYDLVATLAWPELSTRSAMKIGGCKSISTFTMDDWTKFAEKAVLGWPMMRERIAKLSQAIRNELDTVRLQVVAYDKEMIERLYTITSERATRMLAALSAVNKALP